VTTSPWSAYHKRRRATEELAALNGGLVENADNDKDSSLKADDEPDVKETSKES